MANSHVAAIIGAVLGALLLLAGMLFGSSPLSHYGVASELTIQQACLALWSVVVPAWFIVEEHWSPSDPVQQAAFRRSQATAKYGWLVAGFCVALIIGQSMPQHKSVPKPASGVTVSQ